MTGYSDTFGIARISVEKWVASMDLQTASRDDSHVLAEHVEVGTWVGPVGLSELRKLQIHDRMQQVSELLRS